MATFNKVLLLGFLGHDPELKNTINGNPFCRLNLATHEFHKNNEGESEKKTVWHSVHVFGKQAEWACSSLQKGSRLFVEAVLEKSDLADKESGKIKSQQFLKARQVSGLSPSA